jgi:hypothetical protein
MDYVKILCGIAIVVILVCLYKKYKVPKAGFKFPMEGQVISNNSLKARSGDEGPLADLGGSLSELGPQYFRGSQPDWSEMVSDGQAVPIKEDVKIPELPTVQDMLPDGMNVGMRASEPYEFKVAAVQLRDRRREMSVSDLLNSIGRPVIHPIHSVHRIDDANPYRIMGMQYWMPGTKGTDPDSYHPAQALMELEKV